MCGGSDVTVEREEAAAAAADEAAEGLAAACIGLAPAQQVRGIRLSPNFLRPRTKPRRARSPVDLRSFLQTGALAARRREQLNRCRLASFPAPPPPPQPHDRASSTADGDGGSGYGGAIDRPQPLLNDFTATPLRPAVRIFSGVRSLPHVALRGRSLVLADSGAVAFYQVTVA